MNEKIRELMMKATKDMPETYYWPGQYVEKFAELLVEECIKAVDYSGGDNAQYHMDSIKQHFGVEE